MSSAPLLTICYSTLNSKVRNLAKESFKKIPRVEYLLVVQDADGCFSEAKSFLNSNHELLSRDDFCAYFDSQLGVAKSRNIGVKKARARFIWFLDDDVEICYDEVETLLKYLDTSNNLSLLCIDSLDKDLNRRKKFPKNVTEISKWNSAKYGTIELIANIDFIRKNKILFDVNFGAGSKYYFGDEYLFIFDILNAGGQGVHLPIGLVVHAEESTGMKKMTFSDLLNIRLRIFVRAFGFFGVPITLLSFLR